MRLNAKRRDATTLVEMAIICPVLLLLLMGLVIGAAGMFRYQETAHLARKAARYAAVHGQQWAKDTGNPAPTPDDIYNTVIAPNAVILDTSKITYSITYNPNNGTAHDVIVNGQVTGVQNTVTVTVNYQWVPESFLGTINLSSTSVMPMSY